MWSSLKPVASKSDLRGTIMKITKINLKLNNLINPKFILFHALCNVQKQSTGGVL